MTEQRLPLAERTIGDYLARLGSSHPDPGGGSAAGLVGALAAGLGQMVIALTRKAPDLQPLMGELDEAIATLLACSADDERAYSGFVAASRLPKGTPEEKVTRKTAMQAAMITSAEVPLALATAAIRVLDLLQPVVERGTSHALSDAEIAVNFAEVAVLAAVSNINANVPYIEDRERAAEFAAASARVAEEARTLATTLRAHVQRRQST